ncbi:MAG: lon, partial [Deltaproteobacteria bacterium]|nr:lon [Deltaproteobacteria bacterium]
MAEKDKDNDLVDKEAQIPGNIPVLPVRDIVVFPYMIIPLFVGREISIKAIEHALSSSRMILLLTQKDLSIENPVSSDLFNIGTVGMIIRMLKLPDGRVKVLVQGLSKAKVTRFTQSDPFIAADIEKIEEIKLAALNIEDEAQIRTVKEQLDKAVSYGKTILPDIMVVVENLDEPGRLADLVASNLGLKTEQAQEILEIADPVQRLKRISDILAREIELLIVQQKIQSEARG